MFSNWNELKRPTTAYMAYIATRDWTRDPPFYIHFTTGMFLGNQTSLEAVQWLYGKLRSRSNFVVYWFRTFI